MVEIVDSAFLARNPYTWHDAPHSTKTAAAHQNIWFSKYVVMRIARLRNDKNNAEAMIALKQNQVDRKTSSWIWSLRSAKSFTATPFSTALVSKRFGNQILC